MNAKTPLAVAAILTGSACAQTINFSADRATAEIGDTITWTVELTGSSPLAFVHFFDMNINASFAAGQASMFSDSLSSMFMPRTPGVPVGASLVGVSGGQSALLDSFNLTAGDVTLGTFTVVAGAEGDLSYSIVDGGLNNADIISGRIGNEFGPEAYNGASVSSDTVSIVPTPASAALLSLGGAVAIRRRR
ncbi:MAG: hypothetical protein AAF747_00745 [Planctomycetota bacterium]